MNIFRFFGDLSHLASIAILLHKIQTSRSCRGISFKTQALYVVVFITRYLDLFLGDYVSLYNTLMKLFFIGSSCYILYLMKMRFSPLVMAISFLLRRTVHVRAPHECRRDRPTHDPSIDTFRIEFLVGPAFLLALIFHYKFTFVEVLWSFSIFLESVAILPQLFMLQRTGEAETITTHYLAALGAYRGLYIPNWIYRYFTEGSVDAIAVVAGLVQTGLYLDFFYIYFTKVLHGQKFELPA
ncbi:ER lumen protein retaining receptor [Fomitiporia mediterranea MF3/22]|uniref:ER lumen protein retaining receptor n=1 Tax=Fomitiporia mediterranea (strain MF3/22) TaxID=694068 RepID=UPI0004408246|nr:ER lumen protein retaining receptor [Fomitiporia mediterranea MF3/22]EJD08105.1 ER lumen protein retaining receptor [Fomitiporia mediterranea MF3/22]